jgi:hypothetical protein
MAVEWCDCLLVILQVVIGLGRGMVAWKHGVRSFELSKSDMSVCNQIIHDLTLTSREKSNI